MEEKIEVAIETTTQETPVNVEQLSIKPREKWDDKTLLIDLICKARFLSTYPLNNTVYAEANKTLEELCRRLDTPIFTFPNFFQSCR